MLIGYTFDEQLFTSEAFRKFQDTFLNKNNGVIDGCALSNTNNSVSIADGWFVVRGAFLREQGGTTLNVTDNGYYSFVCEIDLSKENTETSLLQATFKLIKGTTTYPTLTQQDITNGGTLYQYEFARFRKTDAGITEFTNRSTPLNFDNIYEQINSQVQTLIDALEQEIDNEDDGSAYLLKSDVDPNSLINRGELTSYRNINTLNTPGIYVCKDTGLGNGYPVNEPGVLEVISTNTSSGYVIQRYSLTNSNVRYERHISEELGDWVKIMGSNDIAVVSGQITLSNGKGSATVNYPAGFNKNNSIVISLAIQILADYDYFENQSTHVLGARLIDNGITFQVASMINAGSSGTKNFKVGLMKIN